VDYILHMAVTVEPCTGKIIKMSMFLKEKKLFYKIQNYTLYLR